MLSVILHKASPFRRGGCVCRRRGLIHQTPNEIPRSWACHSLAFFRLSRSKKGSTPRRLFPYHPILPISRRSAQDDLFKWGAVGILRFLGQSRAPTPTGLCDICYFDCRGDHNVLEENLRLAKWSSAGRRGADPYRKILNTAQPVGDDVLGVPFIKISLSFARTTGGRPYKQNYQILHKPVGVDAIGNPFIKKDTPSDRTRSGVSAFYLLITSIFSITTGVRGTSCIYQP